MKELEIGDTVIWYGKKEIIDITISDGSVYDYKGPMIRIVPFGCKPGSPKYDEENDNWIAVSSVKFLK